MNALENTKKITDFDDKSLLLVDDDNPLEKDSKSYGKKGSRL